jgi:RNA polymerase sigma-70 factor (family 1)
MNPYSDYTDQELATLLRGGSKSAFNEIYIRYNALLLNHAFKKLQDVEQAKDLVQETFIMLWSKHLQLIPAANLPGFLVTSLRNKIFDYMSHGKVEAKYLDSLQDFLNTGSAETDYRVRENQLWTLIQSEIMELPPRMREIFTMSRTSSMSHKEIGAALQISEETVKSQIKSALKILRKKLGLTRYAIFLFFF